MVFKTFTNPNVGVPGLYDTFTTVHTFNFFKKKMPTPPCWIMDVAITFNFISPSSLQKNLIPITIVNKSIQQGRLKRKYPRKATNFTK